MEEVIRLLNEIADGNGIGISRLCEISYSEWFRCQEIPYPSGFVQSLVSLFDHSESLDFVNNAWLAVSRHPLLADPVLIQAVVSCLESADTIATAWSALGNLVMSFPHFFADFLFDGWFISHLGVSISSTVIRLAWASLRFALHCAMACTPIAEWASQLIPAVLTALSSPDERVKTIAGSLTAILSEDGSLFPIISSFDALKLLLSALQSSSASATMPLFRALLTFARRGEVDAFLNDGFLDQLNDAINQHYSVPAPEAFEFVSLLTPVGWPVLLEYGLFSMIIDLADRVIFTNKRYILFCLLELLDVCGPEISEVLGREHGFFEFFVECYRLQIRQRFQHS
jgi:hypothetical protein